MIQFICYPKCSTCKKAQKWLDEHNIEYKLRDIKADNPSADEIRCLYNRSDLPLKKFFNTSGILYRELQIKDKLPDMSEDEIISLLSSDGMLVKRPILIKDDIVILGFKESEYQKIL